ncbi:hypothetical protein BZL41_17690 [Pseudomonas sp. PIC25]|uniref:hypothetical protein n=1 Tax=Pseudomonas sp. PIC25 TaxID=1958773 RepID=UPI000BAB40B7|nr:hypothetical protein [Pseudomonas sp. PIC25]PAU58598.1 hypothetical protein BZL41_17690 [Pseudomonas sp. PIC25]
MSPLLITGLIVAGIVLLIAIAYINNLVENSKLEKARQRADLSDRLRRCADLSETLPGQLMTPALKLLLSRLELQFVERLLPLDKGNATLKTRIDALNGLLAQGESIAVRNAPQTVAAEATAKEIRFQLEGLHGLVVRSAQENLLSANEAKHWVKEIRQMLVRTNVELFGNVGKQALQQNQPRQARLAFERGVQYLRKQNDPGTYKAQLQQFEQLLARADALVLETAKPTDDEPTELTEGLKSLEDEDDWKKKNIYD